MAGTTTRRSTTGRTRARSGGATSPFWRRRRVEREQAPVLELGCGTGRLLLPLARAGVDDGRRRSVGADARAAARAAAALPACRAGRASCAATSARCRSARASFGAGASRPTACCSRCRPTPTSTATLAEAARVLQPRRAVRHRSRARPADVAGVSAPRSACAAGARGGAHGHAGRVRPPGSAPRPDDLRRGVHRAARGRASARAASR